MVDGLASLDGTEVTVNVTVKKAGTLHKIVFDLQFAPCTLRSMRFKEPLINLRIMAHCAFDSRATVWTGS